ncbi:MAG: hypothetical protein V3W04_12880 [Gammaproteobacteria bacterium]
MLKKRLLSTLLPLALFASSLQAETLLINSAANNKHINTPASGQLMATVISRFGDPQSRLASVGNPPISRWLYKNFTVYFENQRVIHSVVSR